MDLCFFYSALRKPMNIKQELNNELLFVLIVFLVEIEAFVRGVKNLKLTGEAKWVHDGVMTYFIL